MAIFCVLGAINLYDIVFQDQYPEITAQAGIVAAKIAEQSPHHELAHHNFNEDTAWEALQPSLQILDSICPEASKWARSQKAAGRLIWETKDTAAFAHYNIKSSSLIINCCVFELKNSERACTIAHEFRHSRQNGSKYWKSTAFVLLMGYRNDSILEDDAYFYECRVREAIYGSQNGYR